MNTSNDYRRGQSDASKFTLVRNVGGSWQAVTTWDYQDCFLIEPITNDYLDGLQSGGTTVQRPNERRERNLTNRMADLMERIAFVMA